MTGKLSENITYFARALRDAGLPVGPGAIIDAVEAVEAAHIGTRVDFYWTLHAIFVKKHEHSEVFDQAFRIFWRRKALIEKIIATLSPFSPAAKDDKPQKKEAGALRAAEALLKAERTTSGGGRGRVFSQIDHFRAGSPSKQGFCADDGRGDRQSPPPH